VAIRNRDRGEVLAETTEKMTRDYQQTRGDRPIPDINADFGGSAIIIVVAIGALSVITACVSQTVVLVTDESLDSDSKL
jgi:hypothetical protein